MKLSLPSFGKKETSSDYYLVLLLRDEKATAVILEEKDKQISLLNLHEEYFPRPLDEMSGDSLLEVLDKTISRAEEKLPSNVQTEKTVFGVKDSWVEEKKIKKECLEKLKTVGNALSLKPIGFLVISEAIAHQIQTEEGAPLSGIVAEIGKYSVTLTLFKGGKLVETRTSPLEETIPKTVDTTLKFFTSVEVLPSRILLLNADPDEELDQQFISHQWSKSLPFLHMPHVSLLGEHFDAVASVYGAASQMEFTVVNTTITKSAAEIISLNTPIESAVKAEEPTLKDVIADEITEKKVSEDIVDKETQETEEQKKPLGIEDLPSDNFGFVLNQDISTLPPPVPTAKPMDEVRENESVGAFTINDPMHTNVQEEDTDTAVIASRQRRQGNRKFAFLSSITPLIHSGTSLFRSLRLPSFPMISGRNKFVFIIPLILLIILALPLTYSYLAHATVSLQIKEKTFEDESQITFAIDGTNDFGQDTVAGKTISVTINGEDSVDASGKKSVGEKAKGTVTLYNNNDSKKTLPAGTTVTSSNNIDFVTDKEIVIASASGDVFSGTKPGTGQVAVTAKEIGSNANLPSGTKFSINNSSALAAKNESAFSGGSKKDITVVDKTDRDRLLLGIPKQLETQAKDELTKKLSAGETLLSVAIESTIDEQEFDYDIGDEAKKVTLKATVTFTGVTYASDDIKQFAFEKIKEKTSTDISLANDQVTQELSDIKKIDDEVTGKIVLKAGLLPKMDIDSLTKEITGKSVVDVNKELSAMPQVEEVTISFSPSLPLFGTKLPRTPKNIKIAIESHE